MIRIKDKSVDMTGVRAEIVLAVVVASGIFDRVGVDLVITSLTDDAPNRSPKSRHRVGLAADLRRWLVPEYEIESLMNDLREALPSARIVLETDHIHIQID